MRVIFVSCLLFLSVLFASFCASAECTNETKEVVPCPTLEVGGPGNGTGGTGIREGGGSVSPTPPAPGTQRMDVFIVKPSVDVAATAGPGLGFWGWLYQALTNFFSPPEEVDFLCGDIGVGVPSTADADTRRDAANAVVQSMFQGLGGQGRPFAERIIVFFADGGLEAYVFSGAASSIVAVPGTLQVGSGVISKCKV